MYKTAPELELLSSPFPGRLCDFYRRGYAEELNKEEKYTWFIWRDEVFWPWYFENRPKLEVLFGTTAFDNFRVLELMDFLSNQNSASLEDFIGSIQEQQNESISTTPESLQGTPLCY